MAGVKAWNQRRVVDVLRAEGAQPRPVKTVAGAVAEARDSGATIVSWASRTSADDEVLCREAGVPLARIEDGFIRSVGLGAGLTAGCSYVLDYRGIYYDASRPSDLEHWLQNRVVAREEKARGEAIVGLLREARVTKYNVGVRTSDRIVPWGRRSILVPGQVAVDAGIRQTISATIDCARSENVNLDLLRLVRERNPGAFVVYKPHPDVAAGLRPGRIARESALGLADVVAPETDILDLIDQCDEVETVSSLAGFEALIRGRAVTVHGMPFYAGWGLTNDATRSPRRTRVRSLEELAFLALVEYGRCVDPGSGAPISVEDLIRRLARLRASRSARVVATVRQQASWLGRKLGL